MKRGLVDLPDRGGGNGFVLEGCEELFDRLAELLLDHGLGGLRVHRRCLVLKHRQRVPVGREVLAGGRELVEGSKLAELHRRTLHLAEHVDELVSGLVMEALEELVRALGGGKGPETGANKASSRLARIPCELGPPLEPTGGDYVLGLVVFVWHERLTVVEPAIVSTIAGTEGQAIVLLLAAPANLVYAPAAATDVFALAANQSVGACATVQIVVIGSTVQPVNTGAAV